MGAKQVEIPRRFRYNKTWHNENAILILCGCQIQYTGNIKDSLNRQLLCDGNVK